MKRMKRTKLLALGAITTVMILGSTLALASQPTDDQGNSGAVAGGGIGRNLKK